jgi:hypothetical protein
MKLIFLMAFAMITAAMAGHRSPPIGGPNQGPGGRNSGNKCQVHTYLPMPFSQLGEKVFQQIKLCMKRVDIQH